MTSTYSKLRFGSYFGTPVDEVPIDYLVWVFEKIKNTIKYRRLYREMLNIFIEKGIELEDRTNIGDGYCFISKAYTQIDPHGNRVPFLQSFWRERNADGNYVYEIGTWKYPLFLEEISETFEVTYQKYVSYTYKYGGQTMIFEKNPNYYFYDGYGKIYYGSYLLRKPYLPRGCVDGKFSKNHLIKNLKQIENES